MAIFVPFETAGMLLQQLSGVTVSSPAIWQWVQVCGQQIMADLKSELLALSQGNEPEAEALSSQLAAQTLVMDSDGVMVPFRPQKKSAQGTTRWREVEVAIMVRLSQGCTRAGKTFTRLQHHRVAAVLGTVDDLSERMWLEALKQGIRTAPQVVWLSDKHRDHIQYDKLKELGLPIGSGLVESACKWLIQQRFKGVGMRWSEDGFNHLLHLRLAWVNGRFDAFFPSTLASPLLEFQEASRTSMRME
jgi:hypothetical protein